MDQNPPLHEQSQTAQSLCDKTNKLPTTFTVAKNQQVLNEPPFTTMPSQPDFTDALRGYKGTQDASGNYVSPPQPNPYDVRINKTGTQVAVWNLGDYSFLKPPDANNMGPNTVNPSLWRQAKLNMHNGLFEVATRNNGTKGIYQVRAFDLSNMTIVETNSGIIVIDPLISAECAKAALDLYRHFRGNTGPVKYVIYTHSHIDHYGGVNGVVNESDVYPRGPVRIYAPTGFLDHAISENAYAGNAMGRRALYMYGTALPKNVVGHLDGGLGKGTSTGNTGLIPPTDQIQETLTPPINLDGVDVVFMLAQDTEAPAEMLFHFPQFKALCAAEDMTHNLHNLYSIRGSQVRNAMAWWKVINEVIKIWAPTTDVIFAQHHWPMWKSETDPDNLRNYLKSQRDLYKYLLDQSLRLLNHGRTMVELAEMVKLPESLAKQWYNRGYYGTVNHDTKAVYQRYMGWYDANPSNLHPHPPVKSSRKYVEYMDGADKVLERARIDFDAGDYRWVAEVLNHVVFANPQSNEVNPTDPILAEVKCLLANALEQMGYQAESGPWRNAYLSGAFELRHGVVAPANTPLTPSVVRSMTLDQYFDYMGLRFNAPKAEATQLPSTTINWVVLNAVNGASGYYAMELLDYTLPYTSYSKDSELPLAAIKVTLDRNELDSLAMTLTPRQSFLDAVNAGRIQVAPTTAVNQIANIYDCIDVFPANFNIVTPRQGEDLP